MNLANLIEQENDVSAPLSKMAHLLLDNIVGRRSSKVLYHCCRFASRHGEGVVP